MATTTGIGVSQTLAIDLAKPGIPKVVYAMQGEGYTRTVSLRIYDDGVQWTPPSDAAYQVSYCKPDGKGGTYSSYTTDTTKPAVEVSGGRLDVVLIPQMLQVAGRVRVEVHMQHAAIMPYAERLSTFTFYVMVQASAESGITSTDYWAEARTDKVVLLADDIGAEANVTHTYTTLAAFFSTPRLGDTVVGSDGYAATVTAASGTSITVVSTGKQWVDFSSSGGGGASSAEFRVRVVRDVTSGTITADKTFEEINHAKANGQAVICYYRSSRESALRIGHILRMESASTANMTFIETEINADAGDISFIRLSVTPVDEWTQTYIPLSAAMVQYSGNIGEQPVSSVKAALDALAAREAGASEAGDVTCNIKIGDEGAAPATAQNVGVALELLSYGMPLNARSDFTASGATSAAGWACRASGSGSNYAVVEGFYQILVGNEINYVRVFGVRENATRVVQIWKHGIDYIDPTIEIWRCTAPGATPEMLLRYKADRGDLTIPNQRWEWQVPDYRSAEKGQVLMVSGSDVKPGWGSLPMATASAAGGVKADAKTGDDVLPVHIDTNGKLWAPQIVDATAEVAESGLSYEKWAFSVDSKNNYKIKPGIYRVASDALVYIAQRELDGGKLARTAYIVDSYIDGECQLSVWWSKDSATGPKQSVSFETDVPTLTIGDTNYLLPYYDGSENGHVVKMVDGAPQWASIDPVDATADFLASGKATEDWSEPEIAAWAAMAKTNAASQYRVAEGKYVIWNSTIRKYNITITTVGASRKIEILVYEDGNLTYFYSYYSMSVSEASLAFYFSGEERQFFWNDGAPSGGDSVLLPSRRTRDAGKFLSVNNGLYAEWVDLPIPTATAADAGKIVTVGADGNYALTELPKYDGGVS